MEERTAKRMDPELKEVEISRLSLLPQMRKRVWERMPQVGKDCSLGKR